jgi:electron transfer flavoprotein alpha subunit
MLPIKDGSKAAKVTLFKWNELPKTNLRLIEEVKEAKTVEKIEDSKILVSLGRGIGSDENLETGIEIAKLLKGTYSCSRALVDAKRVGIERQVGQTGKTVKPEVYLALGISGAIQHVVGMENSEYIIAVNKDKSAPIFQVADIGVVADLNQLLPTLNKLIKKEKNK